jgi:predicted dehydrogenase
MRVGIVGAGAMGMRHAAAWPATPAEVVGVVAKTPDLARPLAECYACRIYPSLEALLPDVDIVDVCTPTYLHYEMVLQAAAARKHVICEKPLARTVAQGQEMIAACQKAGVKLFVGHVVRFFPEYALAKQTVDSGRIGKPAVVRLSRYVYQPRKADDNWFVDFEKSGGMMMDLMIHDFDYARWVAGEVKTVYARNILSQDPRAPVDHGLAILTHSSGCLSHVEGSWAYPPPTFRTMFEIACERGQLVHDSAAAAPIAVYAHKQEESAGDVPLPSSPLAESPYTTEIKTFYNAIAHDAPAPLTAADGLAAIQIALAAIESAQRRAPVDLAPLPEVGP